MLTLVLIAALLFGNLFLTTFLVWREARWLKAEQPHPSRAVSATLAIFAVSLILFPLWLWLQDYLVRGDAELALWVSGALLLGQFVANSLIITAIFKTRIRGVIVFMLVGMIPSVPALVLLFAVVKPFVLDGYIVQNNAMAPTILGWHRLAVCPHCGQPMIVGEPPPEDPRWRNVGPDPFGICSSCRRSAEVAPPPAPAQIPDRIMVNKVMRPRRWDVIAFRFMQDASMRYVKRLIGLPGETLYFKDGQIWINGEKLAPPPELNGIRFAAREKGLRGELEGTPENPWRLGPNDYFVIGDFADLSQDSREWGPVPGRNIEGVVTLRYWPPSRWKMFR